MGCDGTKPTAKKLTQRCPSWATYRPGGKAQAPWITKHVDGLCVAKKPASNALYYEFFVRFKYLTSIGNIFFMSKPSLLLFELEYGAPRFPSLRKKNNIYDPTHPVVFAYGRGAKEYCKVMGGRLPLEEEVLYLMRSGKVAFLNAPHAYFSGTEGSKNLGYLWITQSGYRTGWEDLSKSKPVRVGDTEGQPSMLLGSADSSFFCVAEPKQQD